MINERADVSSISFYLFAHRKMIAFIKIHLGIRCGIVLNVSLNIFFVIRPTTVHGAYLQRFACRISNLIYLMHKLMMAKYLLSLSVQRYRARISCQGLQSQISRFKCLFQFSISLPCLLVVKYVLHVTNFKLATRSELRNRVVVLEKFLGAETFTSAAD